MKIDTYIKLDGIEGESETAHHAGEVEVLSWSWDAVGSPPSMPGGGAAGTASAGDFQFAHAYDQASPSLARLCATTGCLRQAVLSACRSGPGQKDFLKVTMKDVYVVRIAAASGNDGTIVEQVTLRYGSIEFGYQPRRVGGAVGPQVAFAWNIVTGEV